VILAAGKDSWWWWSWIADHRSEITTSLREHVVLTLLTMVIGCAIALPVGLFAHRHRWLVAPVVGVSSVLYTVPSLALFALLIPWTGLTRTTALIPLVTYTLLILIRNTLAGLAAVPDSVRDAATGMGYRPWARVLRVELPLALPAIGAGVRIATVSTIGLITVTAVIGQDSLGQLIRLGLDRGIRTAVVVGGGLSVLLAVLADVVLVALLRLAMPWTRVR
jgi:osmoprotectant transport system permease protein